MLVSFALGCASVLTSLAVPVEVDAPDELRRLEFGMPLAFVSQDQSRYDPPIASFPRNCRLTSPLETPTSVQWPRLGASVLIVTSVLFLVLRVLLTWSAGRRICNILFRFRSS